MNFNNENHFRNQNLNGEVFSTPGLHSPVSQVHALTMNPENKIQALSYLARYQDKMTQEQYQGALAEIKAMKQNTIGLEEKKSLGSDNNPMKNYKQTVDILKDIERNRW